MARRQPTNTNIRTNQTLDTTVVAGGQGPVQVQADTSRADTFLAQLSAASDAVNFVVKAADKNIKAKAEELKAAEEAKLAEVEREIELQKQEQKLITEKMQILNAEYTMSQRAQSEADRADRLKRQAEADLEKETKEINAQNETIALKMYAAGRNPVDILNELKANGMTDAATAVNSTIAKDLTKQAENEVKDFVQSQLDAEVTVDRKQIEKMVINRRNQLFAESGVTYDMLNNDASKYVIDSANTVINDAIEARTTIIAEQNALIKKNEYTAMVGEVKFDVLKADGAKEGFGKVLDNAAKRILAQTNDKQKAADTFLEIIKTADLKDREQMLDDAFASGNPLVFVNAEKVNALRASIKEEKAKASNELKIYKDEVSRDPTIDWSDEEQVATIQSKIIQLSGGDSELSQKTYDDIVVAVGRTNNTANIEAKKDAEANTKYTQNELMTDDELTRHKKNEATKTSNIVRTGDIGAIAARALELSNDDNMQSTYKDSGTVKLTTNFDLSNSEDFEGALGIIATLRAKSNNQSNVKHLIDINPALKEADELMLMAGTTRDKDGNLVPNVELAKMIRQKQIDGKLSDKTLLPLSTAKRNMANSVLSNIGELTIETSFGYDIEPGQLSFDDMQDLAKFVNKTAYLNDSLNVEQLTEIATGYLKNNVKSVKGINLEGTGYTAKQYLEMSEDDVEMNKQAILAQMAEEGITKNVEGEYLKRMNAIAAKDYLYTGIFKGVDGKLRFMGYTQDGTLEAITKKPLSSLVGNKSAYEMTSYLDKVMETEKDTRSYSEMYWKIQDNYKDALEEGNPLRIKMYKEMVENLERQVSEKRRDLLPREEVIKPVVQKPNTDFNEVIGTDTNEIIFGA